nr:outer membrane protein assembly factor BamA [Agaribacterium haliotis]
MLPLFFCTKALAVSFTISDIRLEGLQRVSASPVFAALSVQVGDTVDSQDIRDNIQSLFATGFFANVQMAREGNVLIVILQERPAIKSIEFDGNKAIKDDQLEEVLSDNDIAVGEILQRQKLQGIARELERTYIAQARYGASVDAKVSELPNNMVDIKIDVDEGKSAKIRHINFVGNKVFSDDELMKLFELTTAKWTTIFSSDDQYAKEKLTGDIERLESFYLDQGYLDFSVVSSQVSISPDRRSVYITLNLSEGDIYTVSKVDVGGDPVLPEASVRRLILLREGDTYSQARLDATSEYITTLLGNAGYTNAKVEGLTDKDSDSKTVDLTFFVDPGKRVYVRRIEFSGNTKTSDEVLRREMRQMESSSASNARIEQGKVRLERLGYFKQVNVNTNDVPGSDDLLDVEYIVEEQPSGSISASVGYAQYSGLNLGVNVSQKNWMGTGKEVSFGVNRNSYQTAYNLSYRDPYFTPDGVSRGFNAYYRTRDTESFAVANYSTDTFGLGVRFGYPVSEVSRLDFGLNFEHQTITTGEYTPQEIRRSPYLKDFAQLVYVNRSDWLNRPSGEYQLPTSPIDESMLFMDDGAYVDRFGNVFSGEEGFIDKYGHVFNYAKFDLGWNRFTLNRGILATRGSSQSLRLEATAPGSELEFYKIYYDAQAFKPITRDFVLRFKTSLGYGNGFGSMDELPFFENFYAGGFGSVRGFEKNALGPRGTFSAEYNVTEAGWQDLNGNGSIDRPGESLGQAYILCDDPTPAADAPFGCRYDKLMLQSENANATRNNTIGGNVLLEFSTELIMPIPFIEDSRSMQLAAFVDAGNTFSTYCRDTQANCFKPDINHLASSYGLGFTWISGMGPMTFSYALPLNQTEFDDTEKFQFTFGAGF